MTVEVEDRRARVELEKLRLEADRDVRLREAQRQSGTLGNVEEDEQEAGGARGHPQLDTLAGRTKVFGDAMRHVCLTAVRKY